MTLARYREDGCAEYAVVIASTGELIGDCGPTFREIEGERLPELGWDLRSDRWGHGYATEAARGVLTHAADLGLTRVYSLIAPENERSRGVARRLGMSLEREVVMERRAARTLGARRPLSAPGTALRLRVRRDRFDGGAVPTKLDGTALKRFPQSGGS